MADQKSLIDKNAAQTIIAESSTVAGEVVSVKANPVTGALMSELTSGSISVSVDIGGAGTFVADTATTSSATVTFSSKCNALEINNTDTAIILLVSLDGTTWIEIDPESSRGWNMEALNIRVKSASSTVAYEIVYTVPTP